MPKFEIEVEKKVTSLNASGSGHGKSLIRAGKVKRPESWNPPSVAAENSYIEKNGLAAFGRWHLGIDTSVDANNKGHFGYIFTSDFVNVDRKGIAAIAQRAGQQGVDAIMKAAQKMIEMCDAKKALDDPDEEELAAAREAGTDGQQKSALVDLQEWFSDPLIQREGKLMVGMDGKVILSGAGVPAVLQFAAGAVKEINEQSHTIVHYISTPRLDYVRDIVNPFGMNDEPLTKNRAVFYNHRHYGPGDLPIGESLWRRKDKTGVWAATKYDVERADGLSADIFRMAAKGVLNSYSIGFFPDVYERLSLGSLRELIGDKFDISGADGMADDTGVLHIKNWTLFEYSQVGVPMNMDAIRRSLEDGTIKSGIGISCFGEMCGGRATVEQDLGPAIEKLMEPCAAKMQRKIDELEERIKAQALEMETLTSLIDNDETTTPSDDDVATVGTPAKVIEIDIRPSKYIRP